MPPHGRRPVRGDPGGARRATQGQGAGTRRAAPRAQDMTCRRTRFQGRVDEAQRLGNRAESRVRALVEHPFRTLERVFGFDPARYRGLRKNHDRLCASFALANLYRHRARLAGLEA